MRLFLILFFSIAITGCTQQPNNDDSSPSASNNDIAVNYTIKNTGDGKYTIKGVIKDVASNAPTFDIFNIILEGSRIGTVNKTDGSFQLNVPDPKGKIKIYYMGRKPLTFDYAY